MRLEAAVPIRRGVALGGPTRRGAALAIGLGVVGLAAPCVAGVAVAAPSVEGDAPSDATLARARELAQNGRVLYGEGNFPAAISAFEEAYRLARDPNLLYNISVALERSGRYTDAADALDRYRVYATAEERDRLQAKAAALRERAQIQRKQAEAARRAAEEARTASGGAGGEAASSEARNPAPDPTTGAGVVGGSEAEGSLGAPGSKGEPAPPRLVGAGAWALAGVAAVASSAGIGLGVSSRRRSQGIDDACVEGLCPARVEGDLRRAQGLALGADIAFGVAGAAAVGFAVWVGVRAKQRRAHTGDWAVSPSLSQEGAGVVVRARF